MLIPWVCRSADSFEAGSHLPSLKVCGWFAHPVPGEMLSWMSSTTGNVRPFLYRGLGVHFVQKSPPSTLLAVHMFAFPFNVQKDFPFECDVVVCSTMWQPRHDLDQHFQVSHHIDFGTWSCAEQLWQKFWCEKFVEPGAVDDAVESHCKRDIAEAAHPGRKAWGICSTLFV